jgi:RHS repeat-associated protein
VTRTIWDGDHILYEARAQGTDTTFVNLEDDHASGDFYGLVGYTHGTVIDQPLAVIKDGTVIHPFTNARGVIAAGYCPVNACSQASIGFPGGSALVYGGGATRPNGPPSWNGSLLEDQQDGSGYLYRRNRYYDPSTGRFTQEDPIGLAGGLNFYGYADGDPVNYSDPFGLCIWDLCIGEGAAVMWIGVAVIGSIGIIAATESAKGSAGSGGRIPIYIDPEKGEKAAEHGKDAQAAGAPKSGTVDRKGAEARRKERLRGVPTLPGLDRDEYPPAVIKPDAAGVSIRHIPSSDNRRSGQSIGQQIKGLPDGTKVDIFIGPRPKK